MLYYFVISRRKRRRSASGSVQPVRGEITGIQACSLTSGYKVRLVISRVYQ